MKKIKIIIPIITVLFLFVGCASEQYVPATATVPAYTNAVPNETGTQIAQTAQVIGQALPAPYGTIIEGGATLLMAVLGAIAYRKNQQLGNVQNAAETMARTIVSAGPTLVATAHVNAAQDGTQATVATHIANQL